MPEIREKLANIIIKSSLWNLGKDSHNALSELIESIIVLFRESIPKEKTHKGSANNPRFNKRIDGYNQAISEILRSPNVR